MGKVKVQKKVKNLKITTGISPAKTISTSSTPHLTRNKTQPTREASITLTLRVIFMAQNLQVNQMRSIAAKQVTQAAIPTSNMSKAKTTNTKTALALMQTINLNTTKTSIQNSKMNSTTGSSGTTLTFKTQKITGPTSSAIGTKSKPTLREEPSELLSLVSTRQIKTLISTRKTEDMPRKTLAKAGVPLYRITTSKCSKYRTSISSGKQGLPGRITNFKMQKGTLTAKRTSQ